MSAEPTYQYRRLDRHRFLRRDMRTGACAVVYASDVPAPVLESERRGVRLSHAAVPPVPRGPRPPGTYLRL